MSGRPAPFRIALTFEGKKRLILLDQVRTLDQSRLAKRLGAVTANALSATLAILQVVFAA